MPSRLTDNLNSDYLNAFSALLSKQSNERILVYVESDEDIAFWNHILTPFGKTHHLDFDIQLPIREGLEKGKTAVLKFFPNTGSHLILCVDSDYDYLRQNATETSRKINQNDCVFQTYTYAIENYFGYHESLHALCVNATKNHKQKIDFHKLMEVYSNLIYELFVWSVYLNRHQNENIFPLSDFCETIKILGRADVNENFQTVLKDVEIRIEEKLIWLKAKYFTENQEIQKFKEQLKQLGVERKNTYLFAHGHTIKDNVILMFLKPICQILKDAKCREIRNHAENSKEIKNQINQYKNQCYSIETILDNNTEFKSCFLYTKIESDLEQFIKKHHHSFEE